MAAPHAKAGRRARGVRLSGGLKNVAGIKKNPGLLADIQSHLLKEVAKPTDRRADIIHPSEMAKTDWCVRQTYYRISGKKPTNPDANTFSFTMENIFAEGHRIHSKWQKWLDDMGRLWGVWQCIICDHKETGLRPDTCALDPAHRWFRYNEVPLSAEDTHRVAGHADGGIPNIKSLIEIKSIGMGTLRIDAPQLIKRYQHKIGTKTVYDLDGLWNDLRRPLPSHLKQGNVYLWLAEQMDLPFGEMVFLYEFKANQQVKEFVVKKSDNVLDPLLENVDRINAALDRQRPPDRPEFTGRESAVCKHCPYFDLCYQEDTRGTAHPTADADEGRQRPSANSTRRARRTGDRHPRQAREHPAGPPRGHHGDRRRGADDAVQRDDDVGQLHRDPARGGDRGRGSREVAPGKIARYRSREEQDGKDSDGG